MNGLTSNIDTDTNTDGKGTRSHPWPSVSHRQNRFCQGSLQFSPSTHWTCRYSTSVFIKSALNTTYRKTKNKTKRFLGFHRLSQCQEICAKLDAFPVESRTRMKGTTIFGPTCSWPWIWNAAQTFQHSFLWTNSCFLSHAAVSSQTLNITHWAFLSLPPSWYGNNAEEHWPNH